jgi:hypothetical protein
LGGRIEGVFEKSFSMNAKQPRRQGQKRQEKQMFSYPVFSWRSFLGFLAPWRSTPSLNEKQRG